MGITNLVTLIKEYSPDAIYEKLITDLSGWRICIDASISIYQWCSIGQSRNIVNADGKFINHIQGAFFRIVMLLSAGIKPVFCFDGKPPAIKADVIAKRKKQRDAGKTTRVPPGVFDEVKKLVRLMGVMVVQSPSEAEAQSARTCNAVATEDTDVLTFGADYMIRGLDSNTKKVTIIDRAKVLEGLQIDNDQFIDLCILLGCDYTGTIPGIGYKRALALIKKHKSIENIIIKEKKDVPFFNYVAARREFKNPSVKDIIPCDPVQLTAGDIVALKEFLYVHGLSVPRTKKSLDKLSVINNVDL